MRTALALLLAAATTAAASADPPPPTGTAPVEKPVCRHEEPHAGSRFAGARVCHTRAEWTALDKGMAKNSQELMRNLTQPQGGFDQPR